MASLGEPRLPELHRSSAPWLYVAEGHNFARLGFREPAFELVRRDTRAEHWMARGAVIERDRIVRHAIEHLEDARESA